MPKYYTNSMTANIPLIHIWRHKYDWICDCFDIIWFIIEITGQTSITRKITYTAHVTLPLAFEVMSVCSLKLCYSVIDNDFEHAWIC